MTLEVMKPKKIDCAAEECPQATLRVQGLATWANDIPARGTRRQ
jgi:hypothetical protein